MTPVYSYKGLIIHCLIMVINLLCLCQPLAFAEKLNIVTTTTDLASIAKDISGDLAVVRSLCSGREDPHFLQPKPSYIQLAKHADLWIRIGMDLEVGWEPPILEGARNSKISVGAPGHLDVSESVIRLEIPNTKVTRAMGDVHPHGNPHYWLDPLNGRIIAERITERLVSLDPTNTIQYKENLKAFQNALDERMFGEELTQRLGGAKLWMLLIKGKLLKKLEGEGLLLGGWLKRMHLFHGEKIVSQHRSWIYFLKRFGLQLAMTLEPKPGIPPSGPHLQKVIQTVLQNKIPLILIEPFYSQKAANLVANKTDASVAVCANSVGGQTEVTNYLALFDAIVNNINEVLSP